MNQSKWDQRVKEERERNKAKKVALVAQLTKAPVKYAVAPLALPKGPPVDAFNRFIDRLQTEAAQVSLALGEFKYENYSAILVVQVTLFCKHAVGTILIVTGDELLTKGPEAVADRIVAGALKDCETHVTPPPAPPQFFIASWSPSQVAGRSTVAALTELVPALSTATVTCPGCDAAGAIPLSNVIVHLNDTHRWTRESIADWLDTLDLDLTVHPKGTDDETRTDPTPEYGGPTPNPIGALGELDIIEYVATYDATWTLASG